MNSEMNEKELHEHEKELHEHSPLSALLTIGLIILGITTCILGIMYYQLSQNFEKQGRLNEGLNAKLIEAEKLSSERESEIAELTDKNRILVDSLNSKLESYSELESAGSGERMPTSYPLKGTASIVPDEVSGLVQTEFMCDEGVRVVATAAGIVTKASGDEESGYNITIDHENGYITEYVSKGILLIQEGDKVGKNSVILSVIESDTQLIYKISLENEYIDPIGVMEING